MITSPRKQNLRNILEHTKHIVLRVPVMCGIASMTFMLAIPALRAQTSLDSASRRAYFGIDVGLTGTAFLGGNSFYLDAGADDPRETFTAHVGFDKLRGTLGGLVGLKYGLPLASAWNFEAKARYITNRSETRETHVVPCPSANTDLADALNHQSLSLQNAALAGILQYMFAREMYVIGGLQYSLLLSHEEQVEQSLGNACYYTGTFNPYYTIHTPKNTADLYSASHAEALIGIGATLAPEEHFPIDAELIVNVPLTSWISSTANDAYNQNNASSPSMWYASFPLDRKSTV